MRHYRRFRPLYADRTIQENIRFGQRQFVMLIARLPAEG
jgi:hypothetical protein